MQFTNLVKIFATTFTITAEVDVRKETPIKMPVCFTSVSRNQLQENEMAVYTRITLGTIY